MYNKAQLSKDRRLAKEPKKLARPKDKFVIPGAPKVDPNGYWDPANVGRIIEVPLNEDSRSITMSYPDGTPLDQPLIGIGTDTGMMQYMMPGQDYIFPYDSSVIERPIMEEGGTIMDLDEDEIEAYKAGGYIIEDLPQQDNGGVYSKDIQYPNKHNPANSFTVTDPRSMQDGGGYEIELTDEEIDQYRKGGYVVEELPKAILGGPEGEPEGIPVTDDKIARRHGMPLKYFNVVLMPNGDYVGTPKKKEVVNTDAVVTTTPPQQNINLFAYTKTDNKPIENLKDVPVTANRSQTIMEPDPTKPGKFKVKELRLVPYSANFPEEGWQEMNAPRVMYYNPATGEETEERFQDGGLTKAQTGKAVTSLMLSPYERGMFNTNVNAGAPDQSNFGIGIKRSNMFSRWSKENDVKTNMSAELQVPYGMNRAPGIKGNVTTAYSPSSGRGNKVDFTTQFQGEAGYSPQYGANMNLMAFPHISGSNVPETRWRDDKYYAGAIRAGVGPQLGMSYGIKNKEVQGSDTVNPGGGGLQYGARGFVEYSPTDWLKLKLEAQGMFDPVTTSVKDNVTSPSVNFSPGVNLSATMPLNYIKRKIDKINPKDQTKIDNDQYRPRIKDGGLIKAQEGLQQPIIDKAQDEAETFAYAKAVDKERWKELMDKSKAIMDTAQGRKLWYQDLKPKNFSIDELQRFTKGVKEYNQGAQDYERARRKVQEGKIPTSDFARMYDEKGWGKYDQATMKEGYQGQFQDAADEAQKRKEANMGVTDAVLELTGAPALSRIIQDPMGTLKGVGNTAADIAMSAAPGFGSVFGAGDPNVNPLTGNQYWSGLDKTLDVVGIIPGIRSLGKPGKVRKAGDLISDASKFVTTKTPLKNTYKLNPKVLKENPEMFAYRARPVGQNVDMNMAAQLRAKEAAGEPLTWVQKNIIKMEEAKIPDQGGVAAREKYYGRFFEKDPKRLDYYINPETRNFADDDTIEILRTKLPKSEAEKLNISQFDDAKTLSASPETEFILPKNMVNSAERFPESSWQQLIQEDEAFNTPHWLKGYKEVPVELPGSSTRQLSNKAVTSAKTQNTSEAVGTGLTKTDVDNAVNDQIKWITSEEYYKRRSANTGETYDQIFKDVNKTIKNATGTEFNLNATLQNIEGEQIPRSLNTLWGPPQVNISSTTSNPPMVLKHEVGHLYSPGGFETSTSKLHRGFDNPNVANLPANKRGVYANYPNIGGDQMEEYLQFGYEQQVRHLNARDQILKKYNLDKESPLTEDQVYDFVKTWNTKVQNREAGFSDADSKFLFGKEEDYDDIWSSERNIAKQQIKDKYDLNDPKKIAALSRDEKQKLTEETNRLLSKKITDVLNKAWMTVPAAAAATSMGTQEKRKGGYVANQMTHFQDGGNMDPGNNALELHMFYDKNNFATGGTVEMMSDDEIKKYRDAGYVIIEEPDYE